MARRYAGLLLVTVLALGAVFGFSQARTSAQNGTPCASTTPEQNVAIVEDYLSAFKTGDTAKMDDLLADSLTHNLSRMGVQVPNDTSSNADEIQGYEQAKQAGLNYTIDDIFGGGDEVAVRFTFTVTDKNVTGAKAGSSADVTAIAIAHIECGEISQLWAEFDAVSMLLQLGIPLEPSS
jgi:predicted ester cyclase